MIRAFRCPVPSVGSIWTRTCKSKQTWDVAIAPRAGHITQRSQSSLACIKLRGQGSCLGGPYEEGQRCRTVFGDAEESELCCSLKNWAVAFRCGVNRQRLVVSGTTTLPPEPELWQTGAALEGLAPSLRLSTRCLRGSEAGYDDDGSAGIKGLAQRLATRRQVSEEGPGLPASQLSWKLRAASLLSESCETTGHQTGDPSCPKVGWPYFTHFIMLLRLSLCYFGAFVTTAVTAIE